MEDRSCQINSWWIPRSVEIVGGGAGGRILLYGYGGSADMFFRPSIVSVYHQIDFCFHLNLRTGRGIAFLLPA